MTRRDVIQSAVGLAAFAIAAPALCANLIRYDQFQSAFIDPRPVWVWLPPSYGRSSKRYPVIYMQDGQNLFSATYAFRGREWGMDEAIASRATRGLGGEAIVVGIGNTAKRRQDYAPNAVQALLPNPLRDRIEQEHGGSPLGDDYLKMIVRELKPLIDRTYRTKTQAKDTILMGSSRGAMISLYGLCEYPYIFGKAGCLSTHWLLLSAPSPTTDPNLETQGIVAALSQYVQAKLPKAGRHKVWMDRGTINLDAFYPPYQDAMDQVFLAGGWRKGTDFESRVYEGADHNEAAWRARLGDPLDLLLPVGV